MNRKRFWAVLINPAFLLLYFFGFRTLYQLCRFGGTARRVPVVFVTGIIGILWVIIWCIIYFKKKKRQLPEDTGSDPNIVRIALCVEIVVFAAVTVYYAYCIYWTSVPYNGKLSWYLEKKKNCRYVSLEENNFYESGADGVLSALEDGLDMEFTNEIYVSDAFKIVIDENGKIEQIETCLFSTDEENILQSYLISYDTKRAEQMTVWINGAVDQSYENQKKLVPMQEMTGALLKSEHLSRGTSYTLIYHGYESRPYGYNWYQLGGDGTLVPYPSENYGMEIDAYMLTVSTGGDEFATIVSEEGSMKTIDEIEAQQEEAARIEEAEQSGGTLITDDQGGMTFYLNENTSMKLTVVDAAAGSRFYRFDTQDVSNDDPFDGNAGVAEGIYFINEDIGFILLSGASSEHSEMYYTENGGKTFKQATLPMEDAEADFAEAAPDHTIDEMDYIDVPYEKDGVLYVEVGLSAADMDYMTIRFVSKDDGATWEYQEFRNSET